MKKFWNLLSKLAAKGPGSTPTPDPAKKSRMVRAAARHEMSFGFIRESPSLRLQLRQFQDSYPLQEFLDEGFQIEQDNDLKAAIQGHLKKAQNKEVTLLDRSQLFDFLNSKPFDVEDMTE